MQTLSREENAARSVIEQNGTMKDYASRVALARALPKNAVGVEIGVWKGDHAALLMHVTRAKQLILVDPWETNMDVTNYTSTVNTTQAELDSVYTYVCNRFEEDSQITIIRARSEQAREIVQHYDWVYIDGIHTTEAVMQDIILWGDKGDGEIVVAGHDYDNQDVKAAVDHYARDVEVFNLGWIVREWK